MQDANAIAEVRAKLVEFAKHSVGIMGACTNEQSTKFFLVMPFLGLLGYDYTNPYEVYPEHIADFAASPLNKVDFAILRDGVPIVAIECKKVGSDIVDDRGQLKGYFNAVPPAKLGILTNGIVYEFFVDSVEPNIMDEEPFLTLDLETAARDAVPEEVIAALLSLRKLSFDPDTIAEAAHLLLVEKRLRAAVAGELQSPSEDFCRLMLKTIGIKGVPKSVIDSHYGPMILRILGGALGSSEGTHRLAAKIETGLDQRIFTTDRELEVFDYVRRRLAFLVQHEAHFEAIEDVHYKDLIGKFKVYYCKENKGRLFDFIESEDGCDKFVFPDPIGAIVTRNLGDIDHALKATFLARVEALSGEARPSALARSA